MQGKNRPMTGAMSSAAGVIVLAVALGCAPDAPIEAETIRIGLLFDTSLEPHPQATGAQLAVSQINAAGGVLGRPVELVVGNSQQDPDFSRMEMQRLIDEGIVAQLGPVYGIASLGVPELAHRYEIPVITLYGAYSPIFAELNPPDERYAFALSYPTASIQRAAADAIAGEDLGCDTTLVVLEEIFGQEAEAYNIFTTAIEEDGGEVIGVEVLGNSDSEFSAQIMPYIDDPPECIVTAGSDSIELLYMLQWGRAGAPPVRLIFAGGIPWAELWRQFPGSFREAFDIHEIYHVETEEQDPFNPAFFEFARSYEAAFDLPPPLGSEGMYDAAMLMALAIQAAGTTEGAAVVEELYALTRQDPDSISQQTIPGSRIDGALLLLAQGGQVFYAAASGEFRLDPDGYARNQRVVLNRVVDLETGELELVRQLGRIE